MIIGALECLIFSIMFKDNNTKIEDASDINISDIDEDTVLYIENLEVLERYAFETVDEYSDSEETYEDNTYYVYYASQTMDEHELFAEYYIVKFCDKNNKERIASLTVPADCDIADSLKNTPLQVSACFWAYPISSNNFLLNINDKQLNEFRETSLNDYSQQSQIEKAHIMLEYVADSVEQYNQDKDEDDVVLKVIVGIFGVILLTASVWLLLYVRKKSK